MLFENGYNGELDSGKPDVAGLVPDKKVREISGVAVGPDGELTFDNANGVEVGENAGDELIGAVPLPELEGSTVGEVWSSDDDMPPSVLDG